VNCANTTHTSTVPVLTLPVLAGYRPHQTWQTTTDSVLARKCIFNAQSITPPVPLQIWTADIKMS